MGLITIRHDHNRGYGGNQKTCYRAALARGADIVVMLHPDYQYTSMLVSAMASMIAYGEHDGVLASRILGRGALKERLGTHSIRVRLNSLEGAPDMPDNQKFYIIQDGIRLSGMPAWESSLNEQEIWQVTTFLSHVDKLSPELSEQWKSNRGQGSLKRLRPAVCAVTTVWRVDERG
jgi:hypothetical protein